MIRVYKEDLEKAGIYIDTIMGPYGGYVLNQSVKLPVRKFKAKDFKLLDQYIKLEEDKKRKNNLIMLQDKIRGIYIGSKKEANELNLKDEELKKIQLANKINKRKKKSKNKLLLLW